MIRSVVLAAVAFASTDIDDAFVLLAFFANPKLKASHVVAGQYLGFSALVAAALACSILALAIPDRFIGFLGFLPILIGAKHLWTNWSSPHDEAIKTDEVNRSGAIGTALSVAAVTIANGGDNIAVYVPLFARQPVSGVFALCGVFAAMVAIWCAVAFWLVRHPRLGAPIRRWGTRLMPFALIALGAFILIQSGAIHT